MIFCGSIVEFSSPLLKRLSPKEKLQLDMTEKYKTMVANSEIWWIGGFGKPFQKHFRRL